jgi:hypothetical protein
LKKQGSRERKIGTILGKGCEEKKDASDWKKTRMEFPGLY